MKIYNLSGTQVYGYGNGNGITFLSPVTHEWTYTKLDNHWVELPEYKVKGVPRARKLIIILTKI